MFLPFPARVVTAAAINTYQFTNNNNKKCYRLPWIPFENATFYLTILLIILLTQYSKEKLHTKNYKPRNSVISIMHCVVVRLRVNFIVGLLYICDKLTNKVNWLGVLYETDQFHWHMYSNFSRALPVNLMWTEFESDSVFSNFFLENLLEIMRLLPMQRRNLMKKER